MFRKKNLTARLSWSICLAGLLILCPSCHSSQAQSGTASLPAGSLEEPVPDTEGPVISGVHALTTSVGEAPSYRAGVTATDGQDGTVALLVDSSEVDLSVPGEYRVVYSAEDSSGNRTEVTTTVSVTEPEPEPEPGEPDGGQTGDTARNVSLQEVNDLADQILEKILTDGMSQREKARAVFDYVASHVKYVGSSDKSNWRVGAYDGFTTGRGDCFNYFACSKVLLTRIGVPIVALERVNGNSRHYWVLADVGQGYYHFDPCPHPKGYPLTCFLLTEAEVRQYTANLAAHSSYYINYYTYDYSSCPVPVEGMPAGDPSPSTAPASKPAQPEASGAGQPETPSEPTGEPADEQSESNEAGQDGLSESPADAPPGEAEDGGITAEPEGEEE